MLSIPWNRMIANRAVFKVLACCVGLFILCSYYLFSMENASKYVADRQSVWSVYGIMKTNISHGRDVALSGGNTNGSKHVTSRQTPLQPTRQGEEASFQLACHNPASMNFSNFPHERPIIMTEEFYLEQTRNCSAFRDSRGYSSEPGTQEEKAFPLAYSIIMHTDVDRAERLLRAIYQPQNFYCIHVDAHADDKVHEAMHSITSCFSNVFTISPPIEVFWGKFSVLEVELICMKALWKFQWKYFINLTGQEFPLKTNWELVQIFRTYHGANDVDGTTKKYIQGLMMHRIKPQPAPLPMNVTLSKGSVHIAVQRGFVDFVLHKSQPFIEWLKKTQVPDETFFCTLNHSPQLGVPGSFTGAPVRKKTKPHIVRYKLWYYYYSKKQYDWFPDGGFPRCHGRFHRGICLFKMQDLPALTTSEKMFANKFAKWYYPLAYDCLETWHLNRLKIERQGHRVFNTTYYETLDFVKHHI